LTVIRRYGSLIGFLIFGVLVYVGTNAASDASSSATEASGAATKAAGAAKDIAKRAEVLAEQNRNLIREIQKERDNRTRAVNGVIFLGCSRDNKQDLLLAGLIAGSLNSAPRRTLTRRQRQVVRQYRHKLRDLQEVPVCADVVKAFLQAAGADPDTGTAPLKSAQKKPAG